MKTKIVKILGFVLSAILALCSFVGCTGEEEVVVKPTGESTIEISYTRKSFGDAWIKEAVSRFNKVFADQGISAVITRNEATFEEDNVKNEIKSYKDNTYDLYIMTGNAMTLVDESYSVLRKRGECLLEDLTDVYNSKVLNLDGSEGNKTILETRNGEMLPYCRYDFDNEHFKGKYYGYQWTSAYGGIAVNTKTLSEFGFDHVPRTTKEMEEICETVLDAGRKSKFGNDIYPMTWAGSNASGYSEYALLTWMAQYMGVEEYDDFFALKPKTGTTIENGYEVYDNEGILYALKAMETFFNADYAAEGTVTTITHLFSDQILADGEALFEFTGDWVYSELKNLDYDQSVLDNIEIIPIPVVSELADKIGLSGTESQKDALLSNIIKGVDDGKTDAQIAAQLSGVTEDMAAKVREARGVYYDLGRGHQAYIPSYSDAKDAAKLFLRFISSKEFSDQVYSPNAYGITANVETAPVSNNFLSSLTRCCRKNYSTPIAEGLILSEIRFKGGIGFTFEPMPSYGELAKGMAKRTEGYSAETVYNKVKNGMMNNWSVILRAAGLA